MSQPMRTRPKGRPAVEAGRIATADGHVGYRMRPGREDGDVLAVFHQSPLSGWTHEPLFDHSDHDGPIVLFDTPGYGDSSPASGDWSIEDYADRLGAALDRLRGDRRVVLLGQHTGAHLAMLYAIANPQAVSGVIFHGLSLYTDEERAQRQAHYAPLLEHKADGSHVATYWDRISELYPAVAIPLRDRMLTDYLRAKPDYAHAYRAVFGCPVAPLSEAFAATSLPSRVIVGSEDVIAHTQHRVVERFGSDMVLLDGLTDFAPWEDPEGFAAAVDDFLSTIRTHTEGAPA